MQASRPVFLDLWQIKLPLPGVVSILHRVSGVLMVLSIPVVAVLFHQALSGSEGFAASAAFLDSWVIKAVLLVLAWSLLHHLLAGIRHLFLDIGLGLDRPVARKTAWTVLVGAPLLWLLALALGGR